METAVREMGQSIVLFLHREQIPEFALGFFILNIDTFLRFFFLW